MAYFNSFFSDKIKKEQVFFLSKYDLSLIDAEHDVYAARKSTTISNAGYKRREEIVRDISILYIAHRWYARVYALPQHTVYAMQCVRYACSSRKSLTLIDCRLKKAFAASVGTENGQAYDLTTRRKKEQHTSMHTNIIVITVKMFTWKAVNKKNYVRVGE